MSEGYLGQGRWQAQVSFQKGPLILKNHLVQTVNTPESTLSTCSISDQQKPIDRSFKSHVKFLFFLLYAWFVKSKQWGACEGVSAAVCSSLQVALVLTDMQDV